MKGIVKRTMKLTGQPKKEDPEGPNSTMENIQVTKRILLIKIYYVMINVMIVSLTITNEYVKLKCCKNLCSGLGDCEGEGDK